MSKFKKIKKRTPPISTASSGYSIYASVFFMVTTVMRETEMLVDNTLPQATEVKKLERKSLVSYIYIGSPRGLNRKQFGTKAKIQLNDAYSTVGEIQSFIAAEESRAEKSLTNHLHQGRR